MGPRCTPLLSADGRTHTTSPLSPSRPPYGRLPRVACCPRRRLNTNRGCKCQSEWSMATQVRWGSNAQCVPSICSTPAGGWMRRSNVFISLSLDGAETALLKKKDVAHHLLLRPNATFARFGNSALRGERAASPSIMLGRETFVLHWRRYFRIGEPGGSEDHVGRRVVGVLALESPGSISPQGLISLC